MRILTILLILLNVTINSQTNIDTTRVKSSWYCRIMPYALYTGYGKMIDRNTINIEVGRSIGIMDIGLAYGKISGRPDSTNYLEAKVNMDACQIGIFSNEFTVGFGHVFKSNTPIMLELSSTVFAHLGRYWGLGIVTGYYDFSGEIYGTSKNYFGLYARFGLLRTEGGFLMNRRFKLKHHAK